MDRISMINIYLYLKNSNSENDFLYFQKTFLNIILFKFFEIIVNIIIIYCLFRILIIFLFIIIIY